MDNLAVAGIIVRRSRRGWIRAWTGGIEGVLLSVRRHGESAAIIEVFTAAHGRHAGVVRGGASRRLAPVLQPGAQLDLTWRARLDGPYRQFPASSPCPAARGPAVLGDPLALAGLNAICALLRIGLPEREPHPGLYRATMALLDGLERGAAWPLAYLRWELLLLEDLGFGLDLARCAVTGAREDLAFVSPKTGRAVARGGGGRLGGAAAAACRHACWAGAGEAGRAGLSGAAAHRAFPDA